jgi:hypothetical protein
MARQRSNKAKNLSIKNQLYGSRSQSTGAKTSRDRSGQKKQTGSRKNTKSVQSKVKNRH